MKPQTNPMRTVEIRSRNHQALSYRAAIESVFLELRDDLAAMGIGTEMDEPLELTPGVDPATLDEPLTQAEFDERVERMRDALPELRDQIAKMVRQGIDAPQA
jgi:hypothetical protein